MQPMLNAVELFVGLRYLRAKRRTRFVSFITLISLLGIGLGVAALIVIVSVMNGLEGNLRDNLLRMTAHGSVAPVDGEVADWRAVMARIEAQPGVAAAAPFTELEGMIQSARELHPVAMHGVDPVLEHRMSGRQLTFLEGGFEVLMAGDRGVILGIELAYRLRARVGDSVVLLVPKPVGDGTLQPVLERFVLRGVFETGMPDHDRSLALAHFADVGEIRGIGDAVSAIRFRADSVDQAPAIARKAQQELGDTFTSSDWTIENGSYFRAIRVEKTMMAILLSLIIGVAAFNIVASLVMVVTDKTNDIAVLRTLGMSPGGVVRVFFVQGAVIGWVGVLVGVLLGVVVAINVPTIVPFIENAFGFQIMPGDVFYQTAIPSELRNGQIVTIAVAALVVTSLATLYPSRRAALVNPAAALRYE